MKNKIPIFKIICIVIVIAVAITLYLLGFKITYAPSLDSNWDAIASVGTFIGSILTVIAIYIAMNANKTANIANEISRESLVEMVNQREQSDRPYIVISLDHNRSMLCFVISNEGTQTAQNVKIRFNDEFINMLEQQLYGNSIEAINKSEIHIAPKQKCVVYFASFGSEVVKAETVINISYEYKGHNNIFNDKITFDLKNYFWIVSIDEPLEKIAQSLNSFKFKDLQKNLHNDLNKITDLLKNNNDMGDSDNG